MLKDYYGQQINELTEAVIANDENKVKYILDNYEPEEINSGVSPLFYMSFKDIMDSDKFPIKKRIFDMILNHPKFNNINNDIVECQFVKYPLLHHFLREAGINKYSEYCALALINSEKYTRINNEDGPRTLISALYGNYDFTNYEYSFDCVKAIIEHPNFTNIGNKYYTNSMNPNYKMSALDVPVINSEALNYIIYNDKFDSTMLVENLHKLYLKLNEDELYNLIMTKGLPENIKLRDSIMIKAIENCMVGIIFALIDNDNIKFSEEFYNIYESNIKYNLDNIYDNLRINLSELDYRILGNKIDNYQSKELIDYIINGIDNKRKKQNSNKVFVKS